MLRNWRSKYKTGQRGHAQPEAVFIRSVPLCGLPAKRPLAFGVAEMHLCCVEDTGPTVAADASAIDVAYPLDQLTFECRRESSHTSHCRSGRGPTAWSSRRRPMGLPAVSRTTPQRLRAILYPGALAVAAVSTVAAFLDFPHAWYSRRRSARTSRAFRCFP